MSLPVPVGGEGSKNSKDGGRTHVVCVINRDFTNEEEVLAVEKALRKLEFKCNLYYKPNIYRLIHFRFSLTLFHGFFC